MMSFDWSAKLCQSFHQYFIFVKYKIIIFVLIIIKIYQISHFYNRINIRLRNQILQQTSIIKSRKVNNMHLPRPKTFLIQQDEHLQNLRKIIKRDFFQNKRQKQPEDAEAIPLTLNSYLKNFKSNQNHIFAELVHNDAQDWKAKHEWMQRSKQLMLQNGRQSKPFSNMIGKDPAIKAIDYFNVQQQPKNSIFFSPSRQTKSYNDPEHEKAKKVVYDNCNIQSQEIQRAKQFKRIYIRDPNLQDIPSTPILQGRHKMRAQPQFQHNSKQYSMKRAPSPQPEKIPIMTWGQIQSTPMRIPQGPQYKIPQTSSRDLLFEQLTTKIYKQKMIKKSKKNQIRQKLLSSVRSVVGGSSYRKVSVVREDSFRRNSKNEQNPKKLGQIPAKK